MVAEIKISNSDEFERPFDLVEADGRGSVASTAAWTFRSSDESDGMLSNFALSMLETDSLDSFLTLELFFCVDVSGV